MKRLIEWFKNWMYLRYFRQMKKEADRLHEVTRKKHYLIPTSKGKLKILNKDYIDLFNKQVPKANRMTIDKLLKLAVYVTVYYPN